MIEAILKSDRSSGKNTEIKKKEPSICLLAPVCGAYEKSPLRLTGGGFGLCKIIRS